MRYMALFVLFSLISCAPVSQGQDHDSGPFDGQVKAVAARVIDQCEAKISQPMVGATVEGITYTYNYPDSVPRCVTYDDQGAHSQGCVGLVECPLESGAPGCKLVSVMHDAQALNTHAQAQVMTGTTVRASASIESGVVTMIVPIAAEERPWVRYVPEQCSAWSEPCSVTIGEHQGSWICD